MADQLRTCRRTGCRWPAAATLAFRYATREVWLLDLVDQPDPSCWDLCPHHAGSLTAPRGWDRVDQRTALPAPVEPAGRDLNESTTDPASPREETGSRYAALAAQLPRLAAELAETSDAAIPLAREELDGQLAIPVTEDCPTDDAVVVSIEFAGAHRRPLGGDGERLNG